MPRNRERPQFYVTRQSYFFQDGQFVEIAWPTIDRVYAGALVEKYGGEFEALDSPREAVRVALEVAKAWTDDSGEPVHILFGSSTDLCPPDAGADPEDFPTVFELLRWADDLWNSYPRCNQCGDVTFETWCHVDNSDEGPFCSEYCVDEYDLALHRELTRDECHDPDDCIVHSE